MTPLILGSGRAAHAIATSFSSIALSHPDYGIQPAIWLPRDANLAEARAQVENPLLCIATPHALHANAILEADRAGYAAILCEKPLCVNREQVEKLRSVKAVTAVLHGYRQTWGIQSLRKMITDGSFGELISIEGRYWQSSTAARALLSENALGWKDQIELAGESDTYLDIGSHWIDAASFLAGGLPTKIRGWRSYANAVTPHRDSHVHVTLELPNGVRGFASVSKTIHGAQNHFEVNVLGKKKSATWEFMKPDELRIGEGSVVTLYPRSSTEYGSEFPAFHSFGWIEGYIEIAKRLMDEAFHGKKSDYPKLPENLNLIESMLTTDWQ